MLDDGLTSRIPEDMLRRLVAQKFCMALATGCAEDGVHLVNGARCSTCAPE